MKRFALERLKEWKEKPNRKPLIIRGARQVGKTFIIRKCAKECFENVIEINFIEKPDAVKLFENARSSEDILLRISAFTDIPLIPGKTLIFFDLSHISARNICRNIAIKDEAANKYPALEALNPLSFKV